MVLQGVPGEQNLSIFHLPRAFYFLFLFSINIKELNKNEDYVLALNMALDADRE